jgi:hypothetical protein
MQAFSCPLAVSAIHGSRTDVNKQQLPKDCNLIIKQALKAYLLNQIQ